MVSWVSQKQKIVALSSAKVELISIVEAKSALALLTLLEPVPLELNF